MAQQDKINETASHISNCIKNIDDWIAYSKTHSKEDAHRQLEATLVNLTAELKEIRNKSFKREVEAKWYALKVRALKSISQEIKQMQDGRSFEGYGSKTSDHQGVE